MIALLLAVAVGLAGPEPGPSDVVSEEVDDTTVEDGVESTDAPGGDESTDEDDEFYEVVVYGEILVERARRQVMTELRARGFDEVVDKGDHVIMRHGSHWKGEVLIYDDGSVRMRRQRPRVESPETRWGDAGSAVSYLSCIYQPFKCVRVGGVFVSRRKFHAQKGRTLQPIADDVQVLGDRVADLATEHKVNELPERLEALWVDGVPLEGEEHLATPAERRVALLDYWESRTETAWGERVRVGVEAFVRAEVQNSEFPFTEAEIDAFNAQRTCTRALDLERPWDEVLAEVDEAL